jgi:preprotein translocase subunit SecG
MDILIRFLMFFEAIVCFLLIGIVLLQRSKGQGAGLSFGGGAEAVFGAQMGNVLTRATVVLAVLFLANTTLLAVLPRRARSASLAERISRSAAPATGLPAPAGPVDVEQATAVLDTMATEETAPADAAPAAATEAPAAATEAPAAAPVAPAAVPAPAAAPVVP